MHALALILAGVLTLAGATLIESTNASAEPRAIDLRVRSAPERLPSTLSMRPSATEDASEAGAPPPSPTTLRKRRDLSAKALLGQVRGLAEKVTFRFNLGFGLDGGVPSGEPLLSGAPLDEASHYERLRLYGFGDAVIGTRGILAQRLTTYFASQFRLDRSFSQSSTAIPSIHDINRVHEIMIHSGYAEVDGFGSHRLLAPLHMRAGRQFKLGAAMANFDGLTIGYDTRPLSISAFFGRRVSLYGLGQSSVIAERAGIGGANARLDFFEFRGFPLVITGKYLSFDEHRHLEGGVALRWSRNVELRASLRTLNGDIARESLTMRARVSDVTTVNLEVDNRSSGDWAYDLIVLEDKHGPADPRRYLNVGKPLPRLHMTLRAGTVLLKNLDVLLRGAAAIEHADENVLAPSSSSPSYLEAGGALEVRVRRSLRFGTSATARAYDREPLFAHVDEMGSADVLPNDTGAIGETSFFEGGLNIHYTAGARRFNAAAEFYGRIYDRASPYIPVADEELDVRSGGRFSVEGWAGKRLRLKGEYDVSISSIQPAPELRGVKSLRVLAEGSF